MILGFHSGSLPCFVLRSSSRRWDREGVHLVRIRLRVAGNPSSPERYAAFVLKDLTMRYPTIGRCGSHVGVTDLPSAETGCRKQTAARLRAVSKQASLGGRLFAHNNETSRFTPASSGFALVAA